MWRVFTFSEGLGQQYRLVNFGVMFIGLFMMDGSKAFRKISFIHSLNFVQLRRSHAIFFSVKLEFLGDMEALHWREGVHITWPKQEIWNLLAEPGQLECTMTTKWDFFSICTMLS